MELIKESIFIRMMGENRLLRCAPHAPCTAPQLTPQTDRLHRPYQARGYKDPKYTASKDRCVHSARAILAVRSTGIARCGGGADLVRLSCFNWLGSAPPTCLKIGSFYSLALWPSVPSASNLKVVS